MGNQHQKKDDKAGQHDQQNHTQESPLPVTPAPESSPSASSVVQESDRHIIKQISKNDHTDYGDEILGLERWQHRFTAALVFAAIAQLITATWQGCEMKWQNGIITAQMHQTDETLELMRQERSAIVQVMTPIVQDFESDKQTTFSVILHNGGRTPAKITKLRYRPFFENAGANLQPHLDSWDTDDYHRGGLVIAPDGNIQVDSVQKQPIPTHEINHVKGEAQIQPNMGIRRLFFLVEVFYTDELNTDGHTRALYFYRPDMDRFATDSEYGVMDRKRRKRTDK